MKNIVPKSLIIQRMAQTTLNVLLLIVAVAASTRLGHADDAGGGVETEDVAESQSPSDEQLAAQRQLLNHLVFRDRRHEVFLGRAVEAFRTGNSNDGLAYLQRIFDLPQDSLVWKDSQAKLVSVRREASRVLSELSVDERRAYERLFGSVARRLLTDARRTGDPALFAQVTRRFFHTAAGFEAVDWQATRWLDHGRDRLAARSWQRLISEPAHRQRINAPLRLKAALAYQFSGQHQRAAAIVGRLNGRPVRIGNRTVRPETWLAELASARGRPLRPTDWRLAFGNERRNVNSEASPPFLKPLWTASLATPPVYEIQNWEKNQRDNPLAPMAVANYPIVVGDQVVLRDFQGLRAFSVESGKPLWSYRSQLPLEKLIAIISKVSRVWRTGRSVRDLALEEAFVGNSVLGTLSSDGKRVYAVDFFQTKDARPDGASPKPTSKSSVRLANRLIALPLAARVASRDEIRSPVWTAGGIDRTRPDNSSLAGHLFLGPPLPVDGLLFAMTHSNRQVNLIALSAATGKPIWSQCLALLDQPIRNESQRFQIIESCQPSFADGVVVCPTDAGLVVGVDALTGSLLWTNYCSDVTSPRARSRITSRTRKLYGSAGFANLAQIQDERIVYLPRQSANLFCMDLMSGRTIWKAPREDAEYVAAVTDETVLVVGLTDLQGLSLQTGRRQWSQRFGIPSGRGLRIGNRYLLPLKEGRVANVDIATGREVGFSLAADAGRSGDRSIGSDDTGPRPSNLVAAADTIISLGPSHVAAYPQATALLAKVRTEGGDSQATESVLLAAELELTLGNIDGAEKQLARIMSRPLTLQQLSRSESAMRELLYFKLRTGARPDHRVFNRLDKLAQSPAERGRYLMHKAEWRLQEQDFEGLMRSTHEFSQLKLKALMPTADDPRLIVSPASWISSMVVGAEEQLGSSASTAVNAQVEDERQRVRQSDDIDDLRHFLAVYSRWPQATAVRTRLSNKLIDRGHFQEAELLLLQNRASDDLHTAAVATETLVRLWDRLGLHAEAAGLLDELNGRFADVRLSDGRTGRECVAQFPRHGMTWSSFQRLAAPDWPVNRVTVSEQRWVDNDLDIQKENLNTSQVIAVDGSQFHLVSRRPDNKLTIVDKQSGVVVAKITLPTYLNYSARKPASFVGHFIPFGSASSMSGISLLELEDRRLYWDHSFKPLQQTRKPMRVGPAGSNFCTFQADQHLVAAHPATGRILWRRTDLDVKREGTRYRDPELFGDAQVLVALRSDRTAYTVFQTSTGRKLRHGKIDMSYQRHLFGRKLFFVTNSKTERRMRIWDPLTDRFELDERLAAPAQNNKIPVFSHVTPSNELVIALPSGRLRIFDVKTNSVLLDRTFDRENLAKVSYVRVFSDRDRYYVNFRRTTGGFRPVNSQYHLNSRFLPLDKIEGDLYAVAKATGNVLWKRNLPRRSFLRIPQYRLPFLIGLSLQRIRDSKNRERLSTVVEVIDARTGQTLVLNDDVMSDRFVQVTYERNQGRLELRGLKTQIDLRFGRDVQRIPADDETFSSD